MVIVDSHNLRAFMGLKEWDRAQLSYFSGVPKTTLRRVMDECPCREKTVGKLVKALGVDFKDVIKVWDVKAYIGEDE